MTTHLDFETRSFVKIQETGAWRYAEDPSTEILCIAFAVDDGPVKLIPWFDLDEEEKDPTSMFATAEVIELAKLAEDEDMIFTAHNAFFEQSIWRNILVKLFGWAKIKIRRWRCSAAKAAACALPRALGKAAEALKLEQSKDQKGYRVMMKLARPRIPSKKNPNRWHEDPEDFQMLYAYCIVDVKVERLVDKRLPNLTPFEQEVWFQDQLINMRGVQLDMELIDAAIDVFGKYESDTIKKIEKATKGFLDGVSRRNRILEWLSAQGIELPNLQKATVTDTLKRDDLSDDVRLLLEARRQLGKTSIKKFVSMKNSMDKWGRLRDLYMYHAASTGRWGGKLVQTQNLPRGSFKDLDTCVSFIKTRDYECLDLFYSDVTGALSTCIRGAFVSKPGHDLIVADYASIEVRVLFWLAGEHKGIRKLEKGIDLYVDMAQIIFDNPNLTEDDDAERALGKAAILGLGYGMGAKKFKMTCDSYGMDVSEELAEKAVKAYRSTYQSVVKFWYAQEGAAVKALRTGNPVNCGAIKWGVKGGFLICILPSGRPIVYFRPKLEVITTSWGQDKEQITFMGVNSVTKQVERQHTYGAKLVENESQAAARDLEAYAMINCEKKGYPIAMHVHDELAAEVPEGFGSVKEFENIMADTPDWAKGCPVVAKGWRGKRYRK
jgi:DNA polymerase bacteriophage-type